jgi:predicted methyltransferase
MRHETGEPMMQESRRFAPRAGATLLTVSLAAAVLVGQSRDREERQREEWQRVSDIFQAMDVRAGAAVADIGAGDGFFTIRLATAVGPSGRVFAVDIAESQLDRLRRRLGEEPHENVTVVKGTSVDPRLPDAGLDAALIINAYHEMTEHQAMLAAIRSALKPTGRLVIVEPISEKRRAAARPEQLREHEIGPEFALHDVRAAGFRIIGLQDPFTPGAATTAVAASAPPAGMVPAVDGWRDPSLRISVDDVVTLARSGAGTLIDVRDEGMFAKGHIPNAVLVPLEDIEGSADRLRGLRRPFVTYCS